MASASAADTPTQPSNAMAAPSRAPIPAIVIGNPLMAVINGNAHTTFTHGIGS